MKRQLTPEQKAKSEARREKFRALAKQISSLSDDARQMLAAKLPALATIEGRILSLHNACLIAVQKPDATIVGGFRQWLDAGRCVRKGECGLMIWVPTGKRDKAEGETTTTDEGERPGFIMGTVFDISQTLELGTVEEPATTTTTAPAAATETQPQTLELVLA